MAGKVVSLIPPSTEQTVDEETKLKREMLEWAHDLAATVIQAVLEDAALRFHDNVDDEEAGGDLDLTGRYNPIVDAKTGARLSDAIEESAVRFKQREKVVRRLYDSALKKQWEKQKRNIPADPHGTHYGKHYMVNRHGVWTRLNAGSPELYVWRRIARTQIDPVALSRDTSKQRNWRHRYRISDETGRFDVEVGSEKLADRASPAISILMKRGLRVVETAEARQHLAKFLRFKPLGRVIRAARVGWFEARKGSWVFVLPDETLGDARVDIVLDVETEHHGLHRSGTSEEWREHIARPLANNSNVILAVGIFVAAPTLLWADEPGGGFHFPGPSKIAKTLIAAIGQSVWGRPYATGAGSNAFGFTWKFTVNRIGERAVLRSDLGLGLDEIGIGDQRAVARTVYKLAGGLDKGRFGQVERDFNILFLSTGELSLAEFLPDVRPGQLVRLVDIPAQVQPGSAFETIAESEIAVAGRKYYAAVGKFHGSVGYDWLQHLVALGPKRIKAELERLRATWWTLPQVTDIASRAHPQVISVINRFALVAGALKMAGAAGIVPWSVSDIDIAIIACMERWLEQRGNVDTAGELLREIKRRRQMLAAAIADHFTYLTVKGRRIVPASATDQRKIAAEAGGKLQFDGYVKDGRILVWPDAWRRMWAGLDVDAVKDHLLRAKLLIANTNDETPSLEKFRSGAKPARFYVLAADFVEGA